MIEIDERLDFMLVILEYQNKNELKEAIIAQMMGWA